MSSATSTDDRQHGTTPPTSDVSFLVRDRNAKPLDVPVHLAGSADLVRLHFLNEDGAILFAVDVEEPNEEEVTEAVCEHVDIPDDEQAKTVEKSPLGVVRHHFTLDLPDDATEQAASLSFEVRDANGQTIDAPVRPAGSAELVRIQFLDTAGAVLFVLDAEKRQEALVIEATGDDDVDTTQTEPLGIVRHHFTVDLPATELATDSEPVRYDVVFGGEITFRCQPEVMAFRLAKRRNIRAIDAGELPDAQAVRLHCQCETTAPAEAEPAAEAEPGRYDVVVGSKTVHSNVQEADAIAHALEHNLESLDKVDVPPAHLVRSLRQSTGRTDATAEKRPVS